MKEKENTDLILLNIGYAVHRADWNYKNVNSPFARIFLVKEGVAKLHLQDHVQLLTPGHLYLIPPFTLHSYECDNFYTLYYIHIYENPLSGQRILEDYIFPVEVDAKHPASLPEPGLYRNGDAGSFAPAAVAFYERSNSQI